MRRTAYFLSILTSFHLMASPHALAANETDTQSEASLYDDVVCKLSEIGTFCMKRRPNANEIFADVVVVTPIDMLISWYGLDLGDDPVTKSVIRDSTKIISMAYKVFTDTSVGSTDYKFDSSNLYSQLTKAGIKVGAIAAGVKMGLDAKAIEGVAAKVNFPGDVVSRAIVKAGMDRQKSEDADQAFHSYVYENFNPYWVAQAVSEIVPKSMVMVVLGKALVKSGVQQFVEKLPFIVPNYLLSGALTQSRSIAAMGKNAEIMKRYMPAFMAYPVAFVMGGASAIMRGLTESYILATAARITMDGVNEVAKSESAKQAYVWFFPAQPKGSEEL